MIRNPEQFSNEFKNFANVVNWELSDSPWRVQELPTFELSKLARFEPAYGRCYAVFYNQARIGKIELKPNPNYSTEKPHVTIHVELNWVRLLSFETIRNFLTSLAWNVSDDPGHLRGEATASRGST